MYAICNTDLFAYLTKYGEYEVVKEEESTLTVINNAGIDHTYNKRNFYDFPALEKNQFELTTTNSKQMEV